MSEGNKRPPPFQSRLNPHIDEILEAWYDRNTLREIREMLQKKGVEISIAGLSKFIRSRRLYGNPHDRPASSPPPEIQQQPESAESIKARSDRLGELLRREMNRDPREIEWEHIREENRKKYPKGR